MSLWVRVVALASVIGALLLLNTSAPVNQSCSEAEVEAFHRSLEAKTECAERILLTGDACDATSATPTCAKRAMSDVIKVLGGIPTAQSRNREQTECQIAAYDGARKYLRQRASDRLLGIQSQATASAGMSLEKECNVPLLSESTGRSEPAFGAPCLEASTTDKNLDGGKLTRCIRPRLEKIASSLLGLEPLRPNILLIVTDDQHPEGINSMPRVLAEIVDQGVQFANSFTTTPVCAPSRAGILTGQHATTHNVLLNLPTKRSGGATALDDSSTLATWLQSGGYRTSLMGKYMNGYSAISPGIPLGWDDWHGFSNSNFFDYKINTNGVVESFGRTEAEYSTDVIAARAIDSVRESTERPFFLMFTPFAPHIPSTPAPRHLGMFKDAPPWRPPAWGENIRDKPGSFQFFAVPMEKLPDYDDPIRRQKESLFSTDEAIGTILSALEDSGLADNTVVVFSTDHGILWGEHRWTDKNVPYEESIRIPLAFRYPMMFEEGTVEEAIATNLDIAPTLAELAGVQPTHNVEGRSLIDVVEKRGDWRADILVQHFGNFITPPWDAIRTERYKYVRHTSKAGELYDLQADPYELDNQIRNKAFVEIRKKLSARLDELLQRTSPARPSTTKPRRG